MRKVVLFLVVFAANTLFGQIEKLEIQGNCVIPEVRENISPYILCERSVGKGTAAFYLDEHHSSLIVNTELYDIEAYGTQLNANNGGLASQLNNPYVNSKQEEVVWYRIEDKETGCYVVTPVSLKVLSLSKVNKLSDYILCDDNLDGFATFDLATKYDEIFDNSLDYMFRGFKTKIDAENHVNSITNSNAYVNTQPYEEEIWVRIEHYTGCHIEIIPLKLIADKNCIDLSVGTSDYINFLIYPNPVSDKLNIQNNDVLMDYAVTILDVQSRTVLQSYLSKNNNTTSLNISNLNSGLYFVLIKGNDTLIQKRIIVR